MTSQDLEGKGYSLVGKICFKVAKIANEIMSAFILVIICIWPRLESRRGGTGVLNLEHMGCIRGETMPLILSASTPVIFFGIPIFAT